MLPLGRLTQDHFGGDATHLSRSRPPASEVEPLARELCRCDGYDPDAPTVSPAAVTGERVAMRKGRAVLGAAQVVPAWTIFAEQAERLLIAGWRRREASL